MSLRYVIRDGEKVLQQERMINTYVSDGHFEARLVWEDVLTINEETGEKIK